MSLLSVSKQRRSSSHVGVDDEAWEKLGGNHYRNYILHKASYAYIENRVRCDFIENCTN